MIHVMNHRRSSQMKHEWKIRYHTYSTVLTAGKEQVGGDPVSPLLSYRYIIVIFCRVSSLLSSFSSLGFADAAIASSERLQLNVIFPPSVPPPPTPDGLRRSSRCVHPDRTLGGGNPSPPRARRGPLQQKPESTVNRGNGPEKQLESPQKIHPSLKDLSSFPHIHFTIHSSLQPSHILNLSI